jgi:hypothetical protein
MEEQVKKEGIIFSLRCGKGEIRILKFIYVQVAPCRLQVAGRLTTRMLFSREGFVVLPQV